MRKAAYGIPWIPVQIVQQFLTTKWELLDYTNHKMKYEDIANKKPEAILAFNPPRELWSLSSVKFLITPGAGVDILPLADIRSSNKSIINCHGNSSTVAEHAWALLLNAARKVIKYHNNIVETKTWPDRSHIGDVSVDLQGKTIGILGYGAIGKKLHKFADAFDMEVVIFRNRPDEGQYHSDELITKAVDLDFLILASPLTDQTRGIISQKIIEELPSHCIFVNIARGALIDEEALFDALREGNIRAAALDVWINSPYNKNSPGIPPSEFSLVPNLIISPHRAWVSKDSYGEVAKQIAHELDLIAKDIQSDNIFDFDLGY
ncbi:MAG: hypothetical protein OEY49_13985 [Candidatus Heimdallarchaeota archaeon]|nr:hypothetical protein [Candidatus Heimdallarchaeota archaeon]